MNAACPSLSKLETNGPVKSRKQTLYIGLNDVKVEKSKSMSLVVGHWTECLHGFDSPSWLQNQLKKHDWNGRLGKFHEKWKAEVSWGMVPCETDARVDCGSDQLFWKNIGRWGSGTCRKGDAEPSTRKSMGAPRNPAQRNCWVWGLPSKKYSSLLN